MTRAVCVLEASRARLETDSDFDYETVKLSTFQQSVELAVFIGETLAWEVFFNVNVHAELKCFTQTWERRLKSYFTFPNE